MTATASYEETIGALDELRRQGRIRMIGLSNVSSDQIERARTVAEIAAVQNEFGPGRRFSRPELDLCGDLGIAFLPWRPLGGVIAPPGQPAPCPAFASVARRHGVSPQRVALAWQMALGDHIIPVPGATRLASILDSAAATDLELTETDLRDLDAPCDATEDEVLPPGVLS